MLSVLNLLCTLLLCTFVIKVFGTIRAVCIQTSIRTLKICYPRCMYCYIQGKRAADGRLSCGCWDGEYDEDLAGSVLQGQPQLVGPLPLQARHVHTAPTRIYICTSLLKRLAPKVVFFYECSSNIYCLIFVSVRYIRVYIYVCMCVCVCICKRSRNS